MRLFLLSILVFLAVLRFSTACVGLGGLGGGGGGGGCCCGGCGGGCGCGCGSSMPFGRKKRSVHNENETEPLTDSTSSCNSERLKEIMQKNLHSSANESQLQISAALEEESSLFVVVCTNETVSFRTTPHLLFCSAMGPGHECVAFSG